MRKVPFDMSYRKDIEEGRYKVVTGDDRPVEIIKWDQSSRYPIVAIVSVEMCEYEEENCITQEMAYNYTEKGRRYGLAENSEMNLFVLTDDPELSKGEAYLLSLLDWAYEMGNRGDYRPDFEGSQGRFVSGETLLFHTLYSKGCQNLHCRNDDSEGRCRSLQGFGQPIDDGVLCLYENENGQYNDKRH